MRVLFVSNYYPPCRYAWGYQQLCEEVANGLHAKGHNVAILTSTYGDGVETHPYPVQRILSIDPDWHSGQSAAIQFFVGRRRRERQALANLWRMVTIYQPDILFFWDTVGLPGSLIPETERISPVPTVYYFADYLPEFSDQYSAYWRKQPVRRISELVKRPLSAIALRMLEREQRAQPSPAYARSMCVSSYVRHRLVSQGFIPESAVVVHNGVDLNVFSPNARTTPDPHHDGLRCLIAGRVTPEKGIHTVIEAFGLLRAWGIEGPSLTVLGGGPDGYAAELRAQVARLHLEDRVDFRAPVPREKMPRELQQVDALILASEHAEPLARAIQEAMAMALLVIGTVTGGSGELLVHEETGLVFEAGNPESLAAQIARAANDRVFATQLTDAGRKAVEQHFDIHRTVDQVEALLLAWHKRTESQATG